ncbi:GNAT family N-acetyltransferase [Candidatus Woesearchaeota archaeon]|nr:GNAT family N-acetyltransferase [Candidatus Woesearchaeota archaeon]
MITLRRIRKKDIEEVRNLALKSWRFAYKNIYKEKTIQKMILDYYSDKNFEKEFKDIKKGKAEFIVAIDSNKIVGYAHIAYEKRMWDVIRIYVNPKLLRKGIGSKLISKIEFFLKKKNAKKYTIHPHVKNKIAINFYKKAGFVREPKRDNGWNSPCFIKHL